jgi:TPR repeat protein
MRTLVLASALVPLIVASASSYARYTIDDVSRTGDAVNSACSVTSGEYNTSIQASTFYHQYDLEAFIGEKPQQRRMVSYLCDNDGTSVYYYEYADRTKANNALKFVTPFIWDHFDAPSPDHPEAILVMDNIVVVISGAVSARLEDSMLKDMQAKRINAVSIGKQIETGRQYLQNKNYQQAILAFQEIAVLNHAGAQNYLCAIFITLGKSSEAVEWCTRAANAGNAEAQVRLAKMHVTGKWLKPDINIAVEWLEKASALGNAKAGALLNSYYQYKVTDISDDLLGKLEKYIHCGKSQDQKHVFACSSLEVFRKGETVSASAVDGKRLIGVGVAFNNGDNQPPSLELAGLEFHQHDAVSDKLFRFHATPTEPGEEEIIRNAIQALLNGRVPQENIAYQFVSTSPVTLEPSLAWKEPAIRSTGTMVDGFRILFRRYKNTVTALELHPQDQQVLANRFYIMQYTIR